MNIETNETTHVATVDGYDAEILRVLAEKSGQTPEELILSFFERGCNALGGRGARRRLNGRSETRRTTLAFVCE